jgi:hypothetical protein
MKVNIITLTIALFVTENSAIHLKNFLQEVEITDDMLLTTEGEAPNIILSSKNGDVKNTNLKLKVGKVEPVTHITPKDSKIDMKERIEIKKDDFKNTM